MNTLNRIDRFLGRRKILINATWVTIWLFCISIAVMIGPFSHAILKLFMIICYGYPIVVLLALYTYFTLAVCIFLGVNILFIGSYFEPPFSWGIFGILLALMFVCIANSIRWYFKNKREHPLSEKIALPGMRKNLKFFVMLAVGALLIGSCQVWINSEAWVDYIGFFYVGFTCLALSLAGYTLFPNSNQSTQDDHLSQ